MFARMNRESLAARLRDRKKRRSDFRVIPNINRAEAKANRPTFFIKELFNDRAVASIAPTSSNAISIILSHLRESHLENSFGIELGSGTGAITQEILRRTSRDSKLFGFETNNAAVDVLKQRFADLDRFEVFSCSGALMQETLAKCGVHQVSYVISGVPWSLLPHSQVVAMIRGAARMLEPGGKFIAYQAFLPGTKWEKRVLELLRAEFGVASVLCDRALINLPPLRIFVATKRVKAQSRPAYIKAV